MAGLVGIEGCRGERGVTLEFPAQGRRPLAEVGCARPDSRERLSLREQLLNQRSAVLLFWWDDDGCGDAIARLELQ